MKTLGYMIRALSCFLLLFATWNPLGYSYFAWIGEDGGRLSLKIAAGALLLAIYAAYLRIAWLALGWAGISAALAVLLSGSLMLRHLGVLDEEAPFWSSYLILTLASLVLATGICWAHFKRRVTGQSHVISPPP